MSRKGKFHDQDKLYFVSFCSSLLVYLFFWNEYKNFLCRNYHVMKGLIDLILLDPLVMSHPKAQGATHKAWLLILGPGAGERPRARNRQ